MANVLNDQQTQLLLDKNLAHVATLGEDGAPQTTPVWIDFDGTHILLNTARGRVKDKNLQRDPRVSMSITDAKNPYHYVEIRGRVVSHTEEGANDHIDKMAKKYVDKDKYPFGRPGEVRVLYRIEPIKALGM
jgi:PPOX class probable F420-dependent enzyme